MKPTASPGLSRGAYSGDGQSSGSPLPPRGGQGPWDGPQDTPGLLTPVCGCPLSSHPHKQGLVSPPPPPFLYPP